MFTYKNLGLEMLLAGNNNDLGKITEAWVVAARKALKVNNVGLYSTLTRTYLDTVKAKTGLEIEFYLFSTNMSASGFIVTQTGWKGHGGTKYTNASPVTMNTLDEIMTTQIDLAAGKVSGKLSNMLRFQISCAMGLFTDFLGFTAAETTAAILHEIGHAFSSFASIGEYVYLNYYLTEGIDILQGKKVNKYKVEILDEKWLADNIPEEQRDDFVNNRNESTARRAILSAYKKVARGHLSDNGLTSKRRDEQMADMFPTRLGYARPLATLLAKIDRFDPGGMQRNESTWFGETLRTMAMAVFFPVTAFLILMHDPLNAKDNDSRYDNSLERLMKIRRDLIQQLKILGNSVENSHIAEDIEVIDKLAKSYTSNRTMFDEAVTFFRPALRKMEQNAKHEEQLEELLNNDLFLNIFKLKQL